ncbi:hypothetical protein PALB_31490 [Pseudoalteromonas luteoviolacea B = ATCC 29581]|nr:hypothetical protein PALB_31490 [Pseudoalteromonas luteoviolacea B = ATCC 29581]
MKSQLALLALSIATSLNVNAATWSTTQFHLNHGKFTNPFSEQKSPTTIYSLQHASAHQYGDNFFFVDYSDDTRVDGFQDGDFYSEWYSSLSLSKTTGTNVSLGHLSDISFVMGFNISGDAKVRKYLPGFKLHWNVPNFKFFTTTFTAYIDDSGGLTQGGAPSHTDSWMFDVAWGYPFSVGTQRFYLTGHAEYIDARRNELGAIVNEWILIQPQLQWDLGNALGYDENSLMLGLEWQLWRNKLGTNTNESVPQLHVAWTF